MFLSSLSCIFVVRGGGRYKVDGCRWHWSHKATPSRMPFESESGSSAAVQIMRCFSWRAFRKHLNISPEEFSRLGSACLHRDWELQRLSRRSSSPKLEKQASAGQISAKTAKPGKDEAATQQSPRLAHAYRVPICFQLFFAGTVTWGRATRCRETSKWSFKKSGTEPGSRQVLH